MNELTKKFRKSLLRWNKLRNRREMPWKGEKDPYKIWLSEIILQQTRVEQGLSYYNRFISRFPDISRLAAARDNEVFKLWEGLGYYSRCRNLLTTARKIKSEYKGEFPDRYDDILKLPGIGPYTAAAISSFAFSLPHAVVDGNVIRVLSRYFLIDKAFDNAEGKKIFTALASELLDQSKPGIYNQAIMDFGATVCKPAPLCESCLLSKDCKAYAASMQGSLPLRSKKITKKNRWYYYFLVEHQGRLHYRKRSGRDIWENLHEFILFESEKEIKPAQAAEKTFGKGNFRISALSEPFSQILTHQQVNARFARVELLRGGHVPSGYATASPATLRKKAFPRLIARYITETGMFRKSPSK